MEEQFLFTQIHEALDIPTPPGAYERLRSELTKKPVQPRRWPMFQMRNSKMGFRLAAGLAIVAIGVAAAAAVLAVHNGNSNTSPAGTRMSIQAYQKMIAADLPPNGSWAAPCDDKVHSGCETDATQALTIVNKWLKDLQAANTPARFVVIDAEMKHHLTQSITALNALVADSRAHDDQAMTRDYIVAVYVAAWTNTVLPQIMASQQVTERGYKNIVAMHTQHEIEICLASCTLLASKDSSSCVTNGGVPCLEMFDEVAANYADFSAVLVRDAAPPSLAAVDTRLQRDLAAADAVLLTMRLAVAAGDQAGINAQVAQLKRVTAQIDLDARKIIG